MAADRDINQHLTAVMVVIDVYPKMMREMIVNTFPPQIAVMLIQNDPHQILMNNITSQQQKMVKSLDTDGYDALDLSCLYKVIRHCKFLPPPNKGWGNIPKTEDQSKGDDVERMKRHRNDILHRPRGGLSVEERDYFFQQSIEIATRMDIRNGSPQNGFEYQIEKIKTEIVRSVSKKKYMEALENLAECKEKLHEKDRPCIILCYGDHITKKIGTQYDQEDLKKKEVTVALIKPDVVEEGKVDQIIEDIREAGIEILRHEERQLTEDDVRDRFYSHLQNQQCFHDLVQFMTGGPSHVLVLTKCNNGENIIENFRDLIGPTDVEEAKTYKPESLRAKYGQRSFMNAVHGSSSLDMTKRELALFFPDFVAPAVEGNAVKLQTTLALVRPEAVRLYKDTIMAKICESGFQVAMQKEINFTREMVNEFYKEYQGQEHFDQLIQNMTSGPVLALGLIRENAIREWRNILGPHKFYRAKEEDPYSLQEQFAVDDEINSLHGSDSEESAKKELQLFFPMEETVAVIKPDAMKNKKEIVNRIHAACFRITATKTTILSDEVAKKFYSNCEYRDYYNDLIDHMKSGETYFMGLCREGAVEGWRSMIGPSDPTEAKKVSPDSIRATYGESILRNAVHGSSNHEHAKRSIKTIFGDRSCSCTIVLRDLDIDNEAVLSIKNVILENICTEDIKLIDIEHGSLILYVTIPNWCFMTIDILHERIYTFLHQFFVVASIPCTDGHIFTVVLAESNDLILDNELEKADAIDYLKEKTLPVLKLNVNIKDSAFQDEFVLYREVNRFFSGMYNVIDRHNAPVNGSTREVLMLTPNENDENVASNSEDIQVSQLRLAQEPKVSEEETNYFKISTLLLGIAPRAVKIKFDDVFPPEHLRDTLSLNIEWLTDLKNNKSINPVQWNSMFPSSGDPTSEFFDTTLMICLFRNLGGIQISEQFPPPKDLSFEADLSRIKLYRKKIANSKDRVFSNAKFTAYWNETEAAVIRLSGGKLKAECGKLKIKLYDITDRQKICHKVQAGKRLAQIENMSEVLDRIQKFNLKQQEKQENLEKETQNQEEDLAPKNIQEHLKNLVEDWEKKDKTFVNTRASDNVMECLQINSCVTLTGPSGVGKSFNIRHAALVLQKEGYKIIPVYSPTDIKTYYRPGKQTVFIVDDMCGKFTTNQQHIDNWKQLLPVINTIIADKCCKIIVSCRLHIYKDEKFKILLPFKSCECNLISDKICLTSEEKIIIAKTYIGKSVDNIDEIVLSQNSELFPLLCSLYHGIESGNLTEFFNNPFNVYKNELDILSRHGDEENYKICSLALLVVFNNQLKEKWFQGKVSSEQLHIIEHICVACKINRSTSKAQLKEKLDTLDGTFICKQNGIYRSVHDKLFDFLTHYFGQIMIECLIDHGDSDLVHERFIWQKSLHDVNSNIDFIIEIPDDYLELYLQRLIIDWSAGKVDAVLMNNNMNVSSFRQQLLHYLKQLDQSQQVTLANTKKTVMKKENCATCTIPLIKACNDGYTDIVQWLLYNDVDVDLCGNDGWSPLYCASYKGHTDIVKLLLEKNPNIDLCDNDGCSPLYRACYLGHTDIVKLLLEKNPNVDLCDTYGCCPLYCASQEGHTDIVKLLLEKDPNVDLCSNDGLSPLHLASYEGHTDIVKLLLEKNPNVNLCDNDGFSPLYRASYKGHTDIVELLLKENPNVDLCDTDGCNPLYCASQEGHTDIVKLLLEKNPNVDLCDKNGRSYLYWASYKGHTDLVKLLLEENPNVDLCDKDGCSPLYRASQEGHIDIVKLLLQTNPNVDLCDNYGWSPLHCSSQEGHGDIAKLLLEKDPNVDLCDNDGCSPLYCASFEGHTDIVKLLLDRNPNVDLCDKNCCSPLYWASLKRHTDIVKLLLEKDPNVDLCDKNGCSSLYWASQEGHTDIVKLLLEKNPNVDLCDKNGRSPLYWASYKGHTDIIKLLLEKNPNVDLSDMDGCSPLYRASLAGHTDIVKLLLEMDPNVNLCGEDGLSPLHLASMTGHTDIVKLLFEKNPNVDLCSSDGLSPLYLASMTGHTDILKLLFEKNPNVDQCDKDGCSPLHLASMTGHTDIVKLLLERNPNVDLCDKDGRSPLYSASLAGHIDIVKLLLEKNPNVDLCGENGRSPLSRASYKGHTDIVKLLLEKDPNVDLCSNDGLSPLHLASMTGHTDILKLLFEKNPNVDLFDKYGRSPLYWASYKGHTDIVKLLLERDPNVDLCSNDGLSPLYLASLKGHTDILKLLFEKNPNVDLCDKNGRSPLYWASQKGHTDIVKLLLERNPNVDLCDKDGCSSLYCASQERHTDIVKLLLKTNPNVDLCGKDGCSPLYCASKEGHTDIVKLLLETNPKIDLCDNDGFSPLYRASYKGLTDIVKLLLEKDPNVDLCGKDGCSPLYWASQKGYTDIVKLLFERNPNVDLCDKDGCSPLYWASLKGHTDIVKLLLEKDPNVDLCGKDGCSPLYCASQEGHIDIVKLLLEKNPNVDLCRKDGCSPLYCASQKGYGNIVKLLLERNPNVDLCGRDGCSPLCRASQEGYTDIVKLLLEKNPNVDLCDRDGCSPLCWASREGHTDIVKLLIERNPNVDLCDKDGCSPLYWASLKGHTDIVKLLLEKDPNVDLCGKDGCSPLYCASQEGHIDIVKLLLEKNPNVDLCRKDGCSPLYCASQKGYGNIVKLLLERNPNVDLYCKDGFSPLYRPSYQGHTDKVKFIFKKNPNVDLCDKNDGSPLSMASQKGNTDIVSVREGT